MDLMPMLTNALKTRGDFAGPDESGGLEGADSTDKAMLERSEMEEVTADYANKQA
jgi:hypothetical protein